MRLTKTELRAQQGRLTQLRRYLPTLQLKKAMLQFEVLGAIAEIDKIREELSNARQKVEAFRPFLDERVECDLSESAEIILVKKHYENIAGVEIPVFEKVLFRDPTYSLFDTPVWTDQSAALVRAMIVERERLRIAEEKRRALEKELRDVSIRVNLFEKVLIPRSEQNIQKIKVFLGDQQLAAVAQAKVAKRKMRA